MSTAPLDYRKYAVLYVDDEEQALKYFRRGLDKEFQILTAIGVPDAIAILEKEGHRIGVVLTDQRMPVHTGVDLLKRVCKQWPQIVRILITAYSDIESAIDAVNSGAIYKYITKPADLNALRETLRKALELFQSQSEREVLLRERLAVIQRMIVADRVRSLAAMAGGISHHLRNSMTALTCFLEEVAPAKGADSPAAALSSDPQFTEQLWQLAQKEREHLVQIVKQVGQGVVEPSCEIAQDMDVADLIRRGIAAAANGIAGRTVVPDLAADLPKLRLDPECVPRLLKILLTYSARLSPEAAKLLVCVKPATIAASPGIRVCVSNDGPEWSDGDVTSFFTPFAFPAADPSDLGLDMLTAFFIAYHHGGDILIHKAPPEGPGFELVLPANPASVQRPELQTGLMEKLFSRFDPDGPLPPAQHAA